ncbi:paramyosin-like isoform X2 [Dreissena polymorpha]|uniref:paramyosin-like isoform X2 n=1 Tax=Dreissena polymorpha TaxID=45954 RepID=UPI0022653B67|nr:paramyosin-like isoform X2 [Dreissena polymorpha]
MAKTRPPPLYIPKFETAAPNNKDRYNDHQQNTMSRKLRFDRQYVEETGHRRVNYGREKVLQQKTMYQTHGTDNVHEHNNSLSLKNEELTSETPTRSKIDLKDDSDRQSYSAEKKTSVQGKCYCKIFKQGYVNEARVEKNRREEAENRESDLRAKYNSLLKEHATCPNEMPKGRTCSMMAKATEKGKTAHSGKESYKELIGHLEILNTTKTEELQKMSHRLKNSKANARIMRDKLFDAENKIRELNQINQTLEHENCELQKYRADNVNKLEDLKLNFNNAKMNQKLEQMPGLQLQHEKSLEYENKRMRDAIVESEERERQLLEENNILLDEKLSVITRNEHIESQRKQCHVELINTKHELQRVQEEACTQVERLTRQISRLEETVANLQSDKKSTFKGHLNVSQKLQEAEGHIIQLQQRLMSLQSKDNDKNANYDTKCNELQNLLDNKTSELKITTEKLSNMTLHSNTLNKQVTELTESLKLHQLNQTQLHRKFKEELEHVYTNLKQNMVDAEVSIKENLAHVQHSMESKQMELLDKLNQAEANVYKVKKRQLYLGNVEKSYRKMLEEKDIHQQTYDSNLEEKMQQNHLLEAQKKEFENSLKGAQQQVLRLQYEATEREELLNSLQKNVLRLQEAKESADEGEAQLQRQLKETNAQMQKLQERLLKCQSKDAAETATLRTQVDDLNKELKIKFDDLNNTLIELSKQKNESQMLKEQLNKQKLKFETEARKEEMKHKKDLEYFQNKFQEDVDAALMRVRQNCSELQTDFTFKENELLAKISNAERKIQQLENISSNYHATRQELETTNRKHQEHLKSLSDNERSIQQLHAEIFKMTKDNSILQEHIKTLTVRVDITSEENKNLRQQLETVINQAKINLVAKERQLSDVLIRIEEQQSKHTEEVRQIQIQHQNSIKITSDANLREQKALENKTLLEGKIEMLEKTILEINDDHKHKQQELNTHLKNAQAYEINLKTRLKEQSRELEQFSVLRTNQDSERRVFEETIAEKEHQLKQAKEQLQYLIKETQNLKQELLQTKSKLLESVKNNDASVKTQIKNAEDDTLLRQVNQFRSKEKQFAAEIDQLRFKLKESHNELEETKTRLSKLMGQRLTDNNPNITDLSDKNRPTKLAERYSELYDNEWTDAFEDLNAIYNDEQKTIAMLTVILTEAASYCRHEADGQMINLRNVLTLKTNSSSSRVQDVPDVINKQLKDSRKTMSEQAGKHLVETYMQRLRQQTSASARDALRVETFLREAFTLCWMMSIQDPPVIFDHLLQHGEKFNTELYRSYTKAGPLVDFPVWPTMFLHEGGPVLYKGVAQGCNK